MTNSIIQFIDDDNQIMPGVLGYSLGAAQKLVANSSSSNTSSALSYSVVTITADQPIFFEHSLTTAPAANSSSHYLQANMANTIKLKNKGTTGNSYMAFLAVNITANVYISPRT